MRLVLVHGINQQGKDPEELKQSWKNWLASSFENPDILDAVEIGMPFYGDILHNGTIGNFAAQAAAQGGGAADRDEEAFVAAAMDEVAAESGIADREIEIEARKGSVAGEQGIFGMNRRVNAIARLIERISPAYGRFMLPLVRQAYAYLKKSNVSIAVDAKVMPELEKGPMVVVGHSLGTVVTFKLLRALRIAGRPVTCPLYVTLGSPLGLRAVSSALDVPFEIPKNIEKWLNAIEPDDSVTLGKALDRHSFCDGIENILDIVSINPDSPHDAQGYLRDIRVARQIEQALSA